MLRSGERGRQIEQLCEAPHQKAQVSATRASNTKAGDANKAAMVASLRAASDRPAAAAEGTPEAARVTRGRSAPKCCRMVVPMYAAYAAATAH